MAFMVPALLHPAGQLVTLEDAVPVGIHACEHVDQPRAVFVRRDQPVAIGVEPVEPGAAMCQDLVTGQLAIAVAVDGCGMHQMLALVMVADVSGNGEACDNNARQDKSARDHDASVQ